MHKRTSALNKNPQKLNSVEKKHSFKPKLGFTTGIVLGVSSAIALSTTASVGDGLSTIQSSLNQTSNTSTNITNSYTNTTTSTIPTLSASPFAASSNATAAQSAIEASSVGCGDASQQGSIAWTQQEVIKNRQILNTAPVDIDALFNGSKGSSSGSCFSDITKIIDLSVAIPDWGGMRAAAIAALRQYAQRKVCTMVNEATKKALEPLNNAIDIINKNGTIDLNGAVQGAITGGLGKLDPDLAIYIKHKHLKAKLLTFLILIRLLLILMLLKFKIKLMVLLIKLAQSERIPVVLVQRILLELRVLHGLIIHLRNLYQI